MSLETASAAAPTHDVVTACSTELDLYLHPLLEEPPVRSTAPKETWTEYERLVFAARRYCSPCPLLAPCLYKAVAETDVSGYVGCTTPRERTAIRKRIGVRVAAQDLDWLAGARAARRSVDHDDVIRTRAQHPTESLEKVAERLGCSLSTVKRHLRRARRTQGSGGDAQPAVRLPTMEEVFEAFDAVVEVAGARRRVR